MYFKHATGMLLDDTRHGWEYNKYGFYPEGRGDACWRTALAYLCYPDPSFYSALETMMVFKRRYLDFEGTYHPSAYVHPKDDFSRDQYIMGLAVLHLHGQHKLVKDIVSLTPGFYLSKHARLTPDLFCWQRWLVSRKRIWKALFLGLNIIELWVANRWDAAIYRRMNLFIPTEPVRLDEAVSITELDTKMEPYEDNWNELSSSWRFWRKRLYPMYTRHLKAWMIHCVGGHKLTSKLLVKPVSMDNVVIRALVKQPYNHRAALFFRHRVGYCWQGRIEDPTMEDFSVAPTETYILDRDVMDYVLQH